MSAKTKTSAAEIQAFIRQSPAPIRPLLRELRKLVRDTLPDAREEIKWGRPAYSLRRIVCYLAAADGHASLGFYRGVELDDPKNLLEGSGKKLRHVKIARATDIRKRALGALLKSAAALDAE